MKLNLSKGLESFLFYVGVACGAFNERFSKQPEKVLVSGATLEKWGVVELTEIGPLKVVRDDSLTNDEITAA